MTPVRSILSRQRDKATITSPSLADATPIAVGACLARGDGAPMGAAAIVTALGYRLPPKVARRRASRAGRLIGDLLAHDDRQKNITACTGCMIMQAAPGSRR